MALRVHLNKGWPFIGAWSRSLKTWTSSTNSDDYNYLEKNDIKTDHYQPGLPLLPIPRLDDSCRRYLAALRPIINNEAQYQKTVDIVESFNIGIGQHLHNQLLERNKALRHTSYIADDWMDSYLSSRLPLPLNFNPFLILQDDPDPNYNEPCIKAANFLISCLRFRRSFLDNVLEPYVSKSKGAGGSQTAIIPYDMRPFRNLFASTRIPQTNMDFLQTFPDSKHVVVMKNGNFYSFNALDEHGNLQSPNYMYSCIKYIWERKDEPDASSIGWLTCGSRDDWAKARTHLIGNPSNAASLALIDSALTIICLEPGVDLSNESGEKKISLHGHNFLHGCKNHSSQSILNRWFDKSFSTIFTKDGTTAINFEHSWADGLILTWFHEKVYADYTKNHFVSPGNEFDDKVSGDVKLLSFMLDETIKPAIEEAKKKHIEATGDLDLHYIWNREMDRNYLKSKKLSPDSTFQLCFQMAYFKVSDGRTPATYESCSTSHFKHGRTETIRAATLSTQKACNMFHISRDKYSENDIRVAINDCSQTHKKISKEASAGQGFDRHWFALRMVAEKQGMKDVSLFKDLSHQEANHFTLSTSSLFSGKLWGGGYGPVVEDGFGLAYGYNLNDLAVFCSNYKRKRNGSEMTHAIKDSMKQIHSTLEAT